MVVFVVVKAAKQVDGEAVYVTTEGAFQQRSDAESYVKEREVVWEENIAGAPFYCERAVHETDLK